MKPTGYQNVEPVQTKSISMFKVAVVAFGVGLLSSFVYAEIATSLGLLFSGLHTAVAVFFATASCTIATPVTALLFKFKKKHFQWRLLFSEVALLSLATVGLMAWIQTRQALEIFMEPVSVPSRVSVLHGRSVLFSSYVHFRASPDAIAAIIQSKGLVEVPAPGPDWRSVPGYSERQRTEEPWGWWQPGSMSNPKFFYRHHESKAIQGWSEGWWVNGATNEVYAYISG